MRKLVNRAQRRKMKMNIQFFAGSKLKGLTEQRAELVEEMNGLLDAAKVEERAMTEEESEKFDELEKKIGLIDKTIAMEERAEKLKQAKNVLVDNPEEDVKVMEERAFANFLRGVVEERADSSLTQGNNGAIVPQTIANRIIEKVEERFDFLGKADTVYINGTLSIPVYEDENEAQYIDENDGSDAKNGNFTSIDLTGYVIEAISVVSKKMITNTDFDIVGFVVDKVAEKIANKLDKEFVNGTASKITGIISVTEKVTAAAQTAVTYDELVKTKHSIKKVFRKNGVWLMSDDTYTALCLLKDANNQPYFKDDDYMILGCPVLVSDNMPAMEAGKTPIIFADLKGYTIKVAKTIEINLLNELFARKNGIGVQALIEVDAKPTDTQRIAPLKMAE